MATNTEKSEMLTVYDKDLNPIGERTRAEVHAEGLLHRTIRLWTVHDGLIWFQQRSMDKALFPGRFDLSATGHVDPGESPDDAVLRETNEEIGLGLENSDLVHAGDIPFPFTRPDGKLDNEFASIYLYMPDHEPGLAVSDEVAGLATVKLEDYGRLLRDGDTVEATFRAGKSGKKACRPVDFCCLNPDEWKLVTETLEAHGKGLRKESPVKTVGLGAAEAIAENCAARQADGRDAEYGS